MSTVLNTVVSVTSSLPGVHGVERRQQVADAASPTHSATSVQCMACEHCPSLEGLNLWGRLVGLSQEHADDGMCLDMH